MVVNAQNRIRVDLGAVRDFVRRVRGILRFGTRDFNVCFVDDERIEGLNGRYRHKAKPTDVLSFAWKGAAAPAGARLDGGRDRRHSQSGKSRPLESRYRKEFAGFLGDVVISAETARRNARRAGHSTAQEIRWLILHGVLHLLGYDHESDAGEMRGIESSLRKRLESRKRRVLRPMRQAR